MEFLCYQRSPGGLQFEAAFHFFLLTTAVGESDTNISLEENSLVPVSNIQDLMETKEATFLASSGSSAFFLP